jgi:hypothetical protein
VPASRAGSVTPNNKSNAFAGENRERKKAGKNQPLKARSVEEESKEACSLNSNSQLRQSPCRNEYKHERVAVRLIRNGY